MKKKMNSLEFMAASLQLTRVAWKMVYMAKEHFATAVNYHVPPGNEVEFEDALIAIKALQDLVDEKRKGLEEEFLQSLKKEKDERLEKMAIAWRAEANAGTRRL